MYGHPADDHGRTPPVGSPAGCKTLPREGLVVIGGVMKVNVYVDGFNLYYGALKGQPYRWLDLEKFARGLLHPSDSVHRVRYFTARVKPTAYDVDAPTRQASYLRALSTLPSVSIHYGQFLASVARMPKADGTGLVQVMKTEEKGSDVNLATHLLLDASVGDFETALVVTNDSDLCEPIRQVRLRFDLPRLSRVS